jgi:glutamate-1-semialdehyde 2,1-aminomutase
MAGSNERMETTRSRAFFERAQRVLPGGVSYAIRDLAPYPFYVQRASGSRLWDVDGNEYTDYWCGHGALILGHAPEDVSAALSHQIPRGTHYGFAHPLEVELAEAVVTLVPGAEMIRFTNSGTEANGYAVMLARAATGRTKIVKIEGGWHGGCEPLMTAVHAPFGTPEAAGLNPAASADTLVAGFNDLDQAADVVSRHHPAAFFVEPMMGAAGLITPAPGYLEGLRRICSDHGTLLVFDEVITGFRLAPGGAQQLFGVVPDITVLGKILGGGFPVGALAGRRDVFVHLDHRRFPARADRAFHGGTFSANPVTMCAGLETLRQLGDGRVYAYLAALGEQARRGLEGIFARAGLRASVTGLGSTFAIHFRASAPRNAREAAEDDAELARRYFDFARERGIAFLTPALPHMFLSAAHTAADIDRLLEVTEGFVRMAAGAGKT